MQASPHTTHDIDRGDNGTWLGSRVTRPAGPVSAICAELLVLSRRPFTVSSGDAAGGENPNFDVVVRGPLPRDRREVPGRHRVQILHADSAQRNCAKLRSRR